jgi:hypothetical protein
MLNISWKLHWRIYFELTLLIYQNFWATGYPRVKAMKGGKNGLLTTNQRV